MDTQTTSLSFGFSYLPFYIDSFFNNELLFISCDNSINQSLLMMLKAPIVYVKQLGLLTLQYSKYASFIHTEHSRYYESLSINKSHTKHQDSPPTTYGVWQAWVRIEWLDFDYWGWKK